MDLPVAVGVDGSEPSLAAADWAAREALSLGRALRVLHALPLTSDPSSDPSPGRSAGRRTGVGDPLHEVCRVLAVRYPRLETRADEVHDVAPAALSAAAEDAELLVVGARGAGGFPGLRVGSTALHLAARAGCPTVVLPVEPPGQDPRERIVLGLDARRPAEAALEFAFAAADRHGLPLRVVHAPAAGVPDGEDELLARVLAPWRAARPGVEAVADGTGAGAGPALVEASAKARLLVLGRRRPLLVGALGPIGHAVLHHSLCPVAVVPEA
ncbi:universal stress protein [Kitasatospora sp. NPDC096204]|uniref:universal stress protein n=1 Tax=Kitasatospora sp. NPDC096204 TaxID=3364094 RepID=UPI00382FCB25